MQKRLTIFLAILSLTVVLGGCAAKTSTESDNSMTDKTGQVDRAMVSLPDREADIVGVVKSITGNEVVISKLDMDAMMEQMKANMPNTSSTNTGNTDTEKKTSNLVQTTGGPGGGGMMPGGPGGGRRPDEANSDETSSAKSKMLAELLKNSLGDEKVIVPVGIQMSKRGGDANLSNLTAGTMVSVWLNQTIADRKIAEVVFIR